MAAKEKKAPSYSEAAERLEEILNKIEEGQVDIDELSGLVEEAATDRLNRVSSTS